jgi:anti-sigma B factor antagonist
MRIEARAFGEVTVLDCSGAFVTFEDERRFLSHLDRACATARPKVILNASAITYVNSIGLGGLVRAYSTVRSTGGVYMIFSLSKRLEDLFAITKLSEVFPRLDSLDDVIALVGERPILATCPLCGARVHIILQLEFQRCGRCEADLKFSLPDLQGVSAEVTAIRLRTYDGEHVWFSAGSPGVVELTGRLDLFASEVLERIWKVLPAPKPVLIVMNGQNAARTERGWERLQMLAVDHPENHVAILLTGLPEDTQIQIQTKVPIYRAEDGPLNWASAGAPPITVRVAIERG